MMNASTSPSIKASPIQTESVRQRLPLLGGILLIHLALLGFLILLPKDEPESREAKPLPMIMVDFQPPVPLTASQTGAQSQQPVTATSTTATLTHEQPERTSEPTPSKPTEISTPNPPVQPFKTAANTNAKPTVTSSPQSPIPTSATTPTTNSEHAISASQPGSNSVDTGRHGPAVASTSTSSSSGAASNNFSAPQYGAGYLSNPAPDYPDLARSEGEEGKVLLHVLVTPEGLAKKVKLHRSSGSDSLDDAAVKAVKKWRFVPARLGSQAVEAWVYVPIVFKLD